VLAGWDVVVVTADNADQRALRILGARGADLESALASPVQGPCLQGMVIQAELYIADARVRHLVSTAADAGRTEIRLWGEGWPADLGMQSGFVSHRLSAAARAFKAQALTAVAAVGAAGVQPAGTEEFRRAAGRRMALV
jgi:hypothetical protein